MADYIDRERLLKSIPSVKDDKTISLFGAVADMICIVNSVPKEDVVPVVHARWIKPVPGDGDPCCSECKAKQLYLPYVGYFYSKYCPYCGAKIDAKENDNEFD